MANIQVKDVPAELHRRLRSCARRRGTTIRKVAMEAIRRELEIERFARRLADRDPVDMGVSAAELLVAERSDRGFGD